jgi:prepilin-type N-terminal cleavage/methylation domain-containing protein
MAILFYLKRRSMSVNQRGVTLIELIVVWVIVGACAVLTIPKIGGWLEHYRLGSTARDVASLMRTAQVDAVSKNTEHRVRIDQGTGTLILQRNTGGLWVDDRSLSIPPGIRIKEMTIPGGIAVFWPNAMSSSGSLTLRNPRGFQKRIALTSGTGRVNIE